MLREKSTVYLLLASAFLIATAGLAYELIAGALASYLLGDSVTQFSLTIGIYLFAMGVGSYLSRFLIKHLIERFIHIEIITGLAGGLSAPILFLTFAYTDHFVLLLWSMLLLVGMLVGIEIPLLLRILKNRLSFRDLVSRVLSLDYIGGLAAAVLFPIFLAPRLGLVRSSLVFGIVNILVALLTIRVFRDQIPYRRFVVVGTAALLVLVSVLWQAKWISRLAESQLYADNVVFSEQTPYQRIVLTRWGNDFSLFLNNNLQFNSADEYRYHETLVHPMMQALLSRPHKKKLRILVLGGGDGLAVRELLRYSQVDRIDLVELDPAMIRIARDNPWLSDLNEEALSQKRVHIHTADAFVWLGDARYRAAFDGAVIDFPDPSNFSLGKLYSQTFYHRLSGALKNNGLAATQATSPLFARKSFWCINATLQRSGFRTRPYHAYVPSFGEWGFILFGRQSFNQPRLQEDGIEFRFLQPGLLASMFLFPADMNQLRVETQKLNTQALVAYYTEEWAAVSR